jgi:hypothetical protein
MNGRPPIGGKMVGATGIEPVTPTMSGLAFSIPPSCLKFPRVIKPYRSS